MPDNEKGENPQGQGETPTTPQGGTPPGSLSEALTLITSLQDRVHALNAESADRRKKLEKYEQEEAARAEAAKTELQKAQDKAAALKAELETAQTTISGLRISTAVEREAIRMGFLHPEDVLKLIASSSLEVTEAGEVKGAKEAVEKLAKERPEMVNKTQGAGVGTPSQKPAKSAGTPPTAAQPVASGIPVKL